MLNRLLPVALLVGAAWTRLDAQACSPLYPPIQRVRLDEYLLRGEVVGYVRAPMIEDAPGVAFVSASGGEAWGLRIRPTEVVYAPEDRAYVDVYDYDLSNICTPVGMTWEEVARKYPIGTELEIAAKPSVFVEPASDLGVKRLDAWLFDNGVLRAPGESVLFKIKTWLLLVWLAGPEHREAKVDYLVLIRMHYQSPYPMPHWECAYRYIVDMYVREEEERALLASRLEHFGLDPIPEIAGCLP